MTDPSLDGVLEVYDDMIKWAGEKRDEAHRNQVQNLKEYDTKSPHYESDKHFYRGVLQGFILAKGQLQSAIRHSIDLDEIFPDKTEPNK
jgi:hypothetical protein